MEASSPHAGGERRCFGRVSKDVTQERSLAIKVGGVGDGKGQQAGGKGACGSYGEKSRPPGDKGDNTCSALGHGGIARPRPREQADEGGSFGTPATTDFKTEHNQATPTGVGELRVGTLFCPACFSQRCSSGAASAAPGHTGKSKRRDRCSVNGQLRASPQRPAIGDHLDAALILTVCLAVQVSHQDVCGDSGAASAAPGHTGKSKRRDRCSVNGQLRASPQRPAIGDHLDAALILTVCLAVQVSHQDVCGDSGTNLTADPSSCTFERPTPCPENTRPGAGSDVVTHSIKRAPTAASCRSKWQREPQATEKQDPEES